MGNNLMVGVSLAVAVAVSESKEQGNRGFSKLFKQKQTARFRMELGGFCVLLTIRLTIKSQAPKPGETVNWQIR